MEQRTRRGSIRRRGAIGIAAFALTVAGVASSGVTQAAEKSQAAAARKQLPAITVTDIISGQPYSLDSVASGKPTLLWFWAPS